MTCSAGRRGTGTDPSCRVVQPLGLPGTERHPPPRSGIPPARDTLEAVARAAATLAGHPDPGIRSVGEALAALAEGEVTDLFAFWHAPTPGYAPRTVAGIAHRDRLLAAAANLMPPGGDTAKALTRELDHYYLRVWPRERGRPVNPHPPGSLRALLWELLMTRERRLGLTQVRRVLARQ